MKKERENNAYLQKARTLKLARIVTFCMDFVQFLIKVACNVYAMDSAAHPNRIEYYPPPLTSIKWPK